MGQRPADHEVRQHERRTPKVTGERIEKIRKKMMQVTLAGLPGDSVLQELFLDDFPEVLDELHAERRGEGSTPVIGLLGCLILLVIGALGVGGVVLMWSSTSDALRARCESLGGTYSSGGFEVGDQRVYCLLPPASSTIESGT